MHVQNAKYYWTTCINGRIISHVLNIDALPIQPLADWEETLVTASSIHLHSEHRIISRVLQGLREQTNAAGNGVGVLSGSSGRLTLRQKRVITGCLVKAGGLKGVQRGRVMPVYRARVDTGYAAGGDAAGSTDGGRGGRRRRLVAQMRGCSR